MAAISEAGFGSPWLRGRINFGDRILEIDWLDFFRLKFGVHITIVGKMIENILVDRDIAMP